MIRWLIKNKCTKIFYESAITNLKVILFISAIRYTQFCINLKRYVQDEFTKRKKQKHKYFSVYLKNE